MVEHHLGPVVVEGDAQDIGGRLRAEESPQPDHGARVALAVAARHRDGAQAIAEATTCPLARLPERLTLPVVERDAEVLSEGEQRIEKGRVHGLIVGGGAAVRLLDGAQMMLTEMLLLLFDEPPFEAVLLDTVDRLIRAPELGNYEAAVATAQMACEIKMEQALSYMLNKRGTDPLVEVTRATLRGRGYSPNHELVRQVYGILSGDKIADAGFWSRFVAHAQRRNAVVHAGKRVTKEDAEASRDVARELVLHVDEVLRRLAP
jgi:hypothetical protein